MIIFFSQMPTSERNGQALSPQETYENLERIDYVEKTDDNFGPVSVSCSNCEIGRAHV